MVVLCAKETMTACLLVLSKKAVYLTCRFENVRKPANQKHKCGLIHIRIKGEVGTVKIV